MIVALFYILAGSVLQILSAFLGTLNFIIPSQIQSALAWFFHLPWYFQGVFPVSTLMFALSTYLTGWLLVYGVKLVFMGLNLIPGVHLEFPGHKKGHPSPKKNA